MTKLYENDRYILKTTDNALSEDGRTYGPGYAIVNKETDIVESTGLVLGEMRWRADQFNNMITELEERAAAADADDNLASLAEDATPDVVPH